MDKEKPPEGIKAMKLLIWNGCHRKGSEAEAEARLSEETAAGEQRSRWNACAGFHLHSRRAVRHASDRYTSDQHAEETTCFSDLKTQKKETGRTLDKLRECKHRLEECEFLKDLAQKFSGVFRSLVYGGTGNLSVEKDAEGSSFQVKVKFGEDLKSMEQCSSMEKNIVVLSMILPIQLYEKPHICLLDETDADLDVPYRKALWKWIRGQSYDGTQFIVTVNRRHSRDIGVEIDQLFTMTRQGGKSVVEKQN